MDDLSSALPLGSASRPLPAAAPPVLARPTGARRRRVLPTWFAVVQVLAVSGIPTPLVIAAVLILGTNMPVFNTDRTYTIEFFAMSSLLDTALVALLIRVFLMLSGETSRDVFIGPRSWWREGVRGLALVPVLCGGVAGMGWALHRLLPWTHNVAVSPYDAYMHSPIEATIFVVVVVLAGGAREELQRAFILHRFEQRIGGAWIGLVVYTVVFAAGHLIQGIDATLEVSLLGVVWALFYLRRRSAVVGMVSHAGFDAAQILLVFFSG